MVVYFIGVILIAAVLCGPAWWSARKRDAWFLWDYAAVVAPFALWIGLVAMGIGAQSLANLVEFIILLPMIPIVVSLRVFLLDRLLSPRAGSIIAFGICV